MKWVINLKWEERDKKIRRKILICRIILASLIILSIVSLILHISLYKNSKEVIRYGINLIFERTVYNYDYVTPISISAVSILFSSLFFIVHLIFCRYITSSMGPDVITAYRGLCVRVLYHNGEKVGVITNFSSSEVIEVELTNKVVINVSFYNYGRFVIRVSFSNNMSTFSL